MIVSGFYLFFKPFQPFLPPVVSVPAPLLWTGHWLSVDPLNSPVGVSLDVGWQVERPRS